MKTLWLAVLLLAPAVSARAEGAAALSQDPLTEQIRRKAIMPGAGITAVYRLGNGQALTLKADEQDALSGLKPVAGLAPKAKTETEAKGKSKKLPKEAREQLKTIKKDGWNPSSRGAGHRGAL